MENILIHIGYHKTATSWLQYELFTSDSKTFQPLSLESKGPSTLARYFLRDEENKLLSSFALNTELILKKIEEITQSDPSFGKDRLPVLSHERLSGNPHAGGFDAKPIAERLHRIFPHGKILVVIREQKSFILSSYFQYLSIGGTLNLAQYMNRKYETIPYFSPHHIAYTHMAKEYIRLFGLKNVLILPYELFRDQPLVFIKKLEQFIEKPIEVDPQKFSIQVNKKSHPYAHYHLRYLNRFLFSSSINNYSSLKKPFYTFIAQHLLKIAQRILPKHLDDRIQQQFKQEIQTWCGNWYQKDNEELSEIIGIDLKSYGY